MWRFLILLLLAGCATHAKHTSTWMLVMHTNVNIHISAVGRYEDDLIKRGGKWYILKRVRSE